MAQDFTGNHRKYWCWWLQISCTQHRAVRWPSPPQLPAVCIPAPITHRWLRAMRKAQWRLSGGVEAEASRPAQHTAHDDDDGWAMRMMKEMRHHEEGGH